jgi:hypothetical protein
MMLTSGLYGIAITACAFLCDVHFRRIFNDLKLDLPILTVDVLWSSHVVWSDHTWVILIPAFVFVPMFIPKLPTPRSPESRIVVVRTLKLVVLFILLMTGVLVATAMCVPMIVIHGAVGAQKQ